MDKVVQLNLNATFNVTSLAISHLKKSPAMSSAAGRFGYANRSPYSATNWGIVDFTEKLSIELGEYGIRANAIVTRVIARRENTCNRT